jgi:hypothetical protein
MEGTIEEGEEVMVVDPGGGNVLTVRPTGGSGRDAIDRQLDRHAAADDGPDADEDATTDDRSATETADGEAELESERE